LYGFASVYCTSNNGSLYQTRVYMQSNDGGWHSINLCCPVTKSYSNPPNNFLDEFIAPFGPCAQLAASATTVRVKQVLENMVTHSVDTSYGSYYTLPSSCQ
jgi:regulator of RNase E activity RraA